MRKVSEELGYLNTMRRLWARQREPRVSFPAQSRDCFLLHGLHISFRVHTAPC